MDKQPDNIMKESSVYTVVYTFSKCWRGWWHERWFIYQGTLPCKLALIDDLPLARSATETLEWLSFIYIFQNEVIIQKPFLCKLTLCTWACIWIEWGWNKADVRNEVDTKAWGARYKAIGVQRTEKAKHTARGRMTEVKTHSRRCLGQEGHE